MRASSYAKEVAAILDEHEARLERSGRAEAAQDVGRRGSGGNDPMSNQPDTIRISALDSPRMRAIVAEMEAIHTQINHQAKIVAAIKESDEAADQQLQSLFREMQDIIARSYLDE